jgi:hypothetical protein
MLSLVLLSLALASALIGRFLLIKAAFKISLWWGIGIFIPFGPMVFRLKYPAEAKQAWLFGLATLGLTVAYVLTSPQILPATLGGLAKSGNSAKSKWNLPLSSYFHWHSGPAIGSNIFDSSKPKDLSAPKPAPTPSLDERRQANSKELADLRDWNQRLKLKKRDLLHSDTEGNRMYAIETDSYNAALNKATAERAALSKPK